MDGAVSGNEAFVYCCSGVAAGWRRFLPRAKLLLVHHYNLGWLSLVVLRICPLPS